MGELITLTISKSQGGDHEVCTEGSKTTKFGTDEYKPYIGLDLKVIG